MTDVEHGDRLFDRTMKYCSADDGWRLTVLLQLEQWLALGFSPECFFRYLWCLLQSPLARL